MSETLRMWVEIVFNCAYLIVVWGLVIAMAYHRRRVASQDKIVAKGIMWAFFLLALGDTGHVGFRVLGYAFGDLERTVTLFGKQFAWIGLGALSTAITVTFFYLLMLYVWKNRFQKEFGWFAKLLLVAAVVRLLSLIPAGNQWHLALRPLDWSIYRNLPLILQGLGLAYLILRDAKLNQDRTFNLIGLMILVSYACYLPVVFFVQAIPLIGMLMIPKTLAYIAIAIIAYRDLWQGKTRQVEQNVIIDG